MFSAHTIGMVAAFIATIQVVPYLISIIKGTTKPHRTTYAIWSIIKIIIATSYIAAGATTTAYSSVVVAITGVVIFLLSLKYGVGGLARLDIACLLIAIAAIVCWRSTSNPDIALYMGLTASLLGYAPTVRKSWHQPGTENSLSWGLAALGAFINLFALTSWSLHLSLVPVCGFICTSFVFTLLIGGRRVEKETVLVAPVG